MEFSLLRLLCYLQGLPVIGYPTAPLVSFILCVCDPLKFVILPVTVSTGTCALCMCMGARSISLRCHRHNISNKPQNRKDCVPSTWAEQS